MRSLNILVFFLRLALLTTGLPMGTTKRRWTLIYSFRLSDCAASSYPAVSELEILYLRCYIWDSRSQQPRQPRQPILPGHVVLPGSSVCWFYLKQTELRCQV